ncbi:hypothetical protein RND71_006927 [Anisodus tanguticus]|uniref:Uncharacterized protein n=1 Tax=Anisodus tanguticus TaxID=243964 RepID=A0AAE1SUX6_9SOLA|nr:hypothetical protein RND71_006927 [Anisodus tanguticus]
MVTVNGTDLVLDEKKLGEILGVPTDGLKTVKGSVASTEFLSTILKQEMMDIGVTILKKLLKPEHQLLFELVNKVLLHRAERRSLAAISNLIVIEALATFTPISFLALMIDHFLKVVNTRDDRHGLPYMFFLAKVIEHFNFKTGKAIMGTKKQMFTLSTLEECECMTRKGGVGSNSTISKLIEAHEKAITEIQRLQGDSGPSDPLVEANAQLKAENEKLKQKVDEFREQMKPGGIIALLDEAW